ncbi:DMT family transporter [Candidatus Hodarchaeum mangrovi]
MEEEQFHMHTTRLFAVFVMMIAAFFWGTTYIIVKIGLSYLDPPLPPLGFLFLRFLIALIIIFIPISLLNPINDFFVLLKTKWIIFLGVVNAIAYILQFLGQGGTTSAIAALFINIYLISTPFIAWVILKEQIPKKLIGAIFCGLMGVIMVSTANILIEPPQDYTIFFLSTISVFFSGIIWGGYSVISKKINILANETNSIQMKNAPLIFTTSNFYTVCIIFFSMLFFHHLPNISIFTLNSWLIILYLAICGTLIPFVLIIYASRSLKASEINLITLLNVIVGLILASLVLAEDFTLLSVIGSCLIIIGIITSINTK